MRISKLIWYVEEFVISIYYYFYGWAVAFLNALYADPNFILKNHETDPYRPWVIKVAKLKKKILKS